MEDIFEILVENFMEERLDDIALKDEKFCSENKKLDEALKKYHELSLQKKEIDVIDYAFDMYAAQSAKYAALAYRQGIIDTVKLLKKMGVIGR